ncbi:MAG TPA: polysaccharide deacetylase family protein [Pyrinomonadaceae bacterium]|jgi:peptidoglycan/xylan/chitin deacetylase (PgdA/CDA1 family)
MMRAISIMYHDVTEAGEGHTSGFTGPDAALYKLERERFGEHLRAIASARTDEPARVTEIAEHSEGAPWLLTFDDGGVSAYTCIAEMLEERGWRGHFFVTTGRIDEPAFLSRGQIVELHRRGHVIGSHSTTHPLRMSHCRPEEMLEEWKTSVETLSGILGQQVRVASVPGGFYSREVAETAARAGVEALFTSEPVTKCRRIEGCLVLGRYTVQRRTAPERIAALASGHFTPRMRQLLFWNAKKITKSLGGEYYLKLRKSLLSQERN